MISGHLVYALLWISFGVLHSALTSFSVKAQLSPMFGNRYRFLYNIVAIVHLGFVLICGKYLYRTTTHSVLDDTWNPIFYMLFAVGAVISMISLRQYDLGLFSGIKQLRSVNVAAMATNAPEESLTLTGIHQYVRHPLYSGIFLLLWSMAGSVFGMMTAIYASLYLLAGTKYEENKLVELYGAQYRDYQMRVPAFIPYRGKVSLS